VDRIRNANSDLYWVARFVIGLARRGCASWAIRIRRCFSSPLDYSMENSSKLSAGYAGAQTSELFQNRGLHCRLE
jgi:hypothetical protein